MVMMVNPANDNDLGVYAASAKSVVRAVIPMEPPSGGTFQPGTTGGQVVDLEDDTKQT